MAIVERLICDCCKLEIKDCRNDYTINLSEIYKKAIRLISTGRDPDPAGGRSECREISLDFCEGCARRLVVSIEKLTQ